MVKREGDGQNSNTSSLNVQVVSANDTMLAGKQEPRNNGLSVSTKLCYAIGGVPHQITGCALGFFLPIYLLDVAQLDPYCASIVLFVGCLWAAMMGPIVGFLISCSPWTRMGRMLPWIGLSTPFAVLSYLLIWYVPPFARGNVVWHLVFYCLYQTLQTCFDVPYSALTMFISSEQKERDSATAYRMTAEVLAVVVGAAIQGQMVGMVDAPCLLHASNNVTEDLDSSSLLAANTTHSPFSLEHTEVAYLMASGTISAVYFLCAVILFFGVRERKESCCPRSEPRPFFQGLKMIMRHGPYVKLVTGFLFTTLAYKLLSGNFALFCSYTLGVRNDFKNIVLVIMLSTTLTIPFWQWFQTRFGKKTAVYVGSSSVVPFLILVVCVKSNLIVTYVVSLAAGVSVAAAYLLPWSMLPDVVDDFKVHNPDSTGHEAICYSFYILSAKLASGVAQGISTLSLEFAGYIPQVCSQPEEVNLALKLLVSAAPVALLLVSFAIFYSYPIDEEMRQANRKQLQELQDNEANSEDSI